MISGIIIFGEMGSGKDELADLLKRSIKNSEVYKLGMLCRDIMRIVKVNHNWIDKERELGQTIADKLREIDQNIMNDYVLSLIFEHSNCDPSKNKSDTLTNQLGNENIFPIVCGGRTKEDLNYWRKKGFIVVGIKTDERTRKERLKKRNDEKNYEKDFEHITELEAKEIVSQDCDYCFSNDDSLEDLELKVKDFLKECEVLSTKQSC
ncbi:AAA family ATPase [Paenibacillus sp. FSL R7-0302]|uniref:AAA family ATPase n=1 Tax=Paenibacillus sp. FSL R7-0302 TaxID=2921681 RepID=UPI0030F974E0